MKFHAITGLPRSGSTLLCNVLNENPKFHASSTSVLAQAVAGLTSLWSNSPEIKSDLARDQDGTNLRMEGAIWALCEAWYAEHKDKTVFDKGRGWSFHALALKQVYPDAKIIVMVRDLRSVFASVEKQHRKNPILDHAMHPLEKTIHTRADQMMAADGMIGGPVNGVMDLVRRQPPGVVVAQYETFVQSPAMVMERIYAELGEKPFKHDFENVENTATDLDPLYLDKFPHDGSGRIQPGEDWQPYVSGDLAAQIMNRYPGYNQAFGYVSNG